MKFFIALHEVIKDDTTFQLYVSVSTTHEPRFQQRSIQSAYLEMNDSKRCIISKSKCNTIDRHGIVKMKTIARQDAKQQINQSLKALR